MIAALTGLAVATFAGIIADARRITKRARREAHAKRYRRRLSARLARQANDVGYLELRSRAR